MAMTIDDHTFLPHNILAVRFPAALVELIDAEVSRSRRRNPGITITRSDVIRYCCQTMLGERPAPKPKKEPAHAR